MRSAQPSRRSPAAASTIASYCPSSSLRSRVSTLPRRFSITSPRPSACNCAARRSELVPTFAPSPQLRQRLADQRVARIFALRDRRQRQARRQLRRHILQAMHRQVDRPRQQRLFDFLGEQSLAADLRQRHVGDLVAGGLDDFDAASRRPASARHAAICRACHSASCDPRDPMTITIVTLLPAGTACEWCESAATPSGSSALRRSSVMGPCAILLMMPRVIASIASSCCGVSTPSLARTRSISAMRTCSSCSCRLTMVGVTSRVFSRSIIRSTSSRMISSACSRHVHARLQIAF